MQEHLRGRIEQQLQACSGLSMADYSVLSVLSGAPGGRLRAYCLSATLGWEKSRLHHQLTRMCQRGLVERHAGESRAIYVQITPQGLTTLEQAAPQHSRHVRRLVIDRLIPDQLDQPAGAHYVKAFAPCRPTHSPPARTGLPAGRCCSTPPTTTAQPRRSSGSIT